MTEPTEQWRRERITKTDAARRQLKFAIRSLLAGDDIIVVHTLTGASHQVLENLLQHAGKQGLINQNVFVHSKRRDEFSNRVNKARNFLKHADHDPEAIFEFDPRNTHFWVCDAVWMCWKLTGKLGFEETVFISWFCTQHPDMLDVDILGGEFVETMRHLHMAPAINKLLEQAKDPKFWADLSEPEKGGTDGENHQA